MSMQTSMSNVPEWDNADRMRKALRYSGVGVQEIADYLGVARNTVSTWINGRIEPSRQTMRLWALRCGVSYEWLTGEAPGPHGGGEVDAAPPLTSQDARADSRCRLHLIPALLTAQQAANARHHTTAERPKPGGVAHGNVAA